MENDVNMEDHAMHSSKHYTNRRRLSARIFLGIAIALVLILTGAYIYDTLIDVDRSSDATAETDTEPACFQTEEELVSALGANEAYADLYNNVLLNKKENTGGHTLSGTKTSKYGMYVIPGLNGMKTLNISTGKVDLCTDMVPQGLTVAENYLIFTAYCHEKEHNSVIVVMDKDSGDFVKEIPLDGKPHVGGIAYDGNHQMVWVSGKRDGKATAIGLSLDSIEAYDSDEMSAPVSYTFEEALPELKANSFMTCKNNILYAGYFNIEGNGVIQRYMIRGDGSLLIRDEEQSLLDGLLTDLVPVEADLFAVILPKIQGMSFMNSNLLLTQSYGPMDSKMMVSDETDLENGQNDLTDSHIIGSYICPSYLEYVCYSEEDGKTYFLFEGAAKNYRDRASVPVDRILCINTEI